MSNLYQPKHIANANGVLESSYDYFKRAGFPEFGCDMLHCNNADTRSAIGSLIAHRIVSKFEKPNPARRAELTTACYAGWIDFEAELGSFRFDKLSSKVRSNAYKASALLHAWFKDFKLGTDVEFTPGETFTSNQGAVSVYQKLSRKHNWCVTHDAADAFIRLCYNHTGLKRCATKFFSRITQGNAKLLYASAPEGVHAGFWCFSQRMYAEVLTLVHGSRASSVDKSNEKRRFINVEPFCNIVLQRFVAQGFRACLKSVGNDLEVGQQVHRERISYASNATIDFSNASDSTLLDVCNRLFPSRVAKPLNLYRSPMVLVNGDYHIPYKLSSMGNGFTFEVMSALLLACARVFDPHATVYGDDVIIANESAIEFIELASGLGYKVNQKKTFIDSPFRESCGAFYLDGFGYITSFDIHFIEDDSDLIVTTNKFRLMAENAPDFLKVHLIGVYKALLDCVPLRFMGPPIEPESLQDFVPSVRYRKERMRSIDMVNQWKRCSTELDFLKTAYGTHAWVLLSKVKYVLSDVTKAPRTVPDLGARFAHYMYAGMVSKDQNRNKGRWIENLYFCDEIGTMISVKEVRRLINAQDYFAALEYVRYLAYCVAWIAVRCNLPITIEKRKFPRAA